MMSDRARELLTEILGSTAITSERFERGVELIEAEFNRIRELKFTEVMADVDAKHAQQLREIECRNAKVMLELRAEDAAQIERIKNSVDVEKIRADERERCAKEIDIRRAGLLTIGENKEADETYACAVLIRGIK